MKSCGSCQYFIKFKNDRFSGGLCEFLDCRTNTDHGRKCKYHKRIPYQRDNQTIEYDIDEDT